MNYELHRRDWIKAVSRLNNQKNIAETNLRIVKNILDKEVDKKLNQDRIDGLLELYNTYHNEISIINNKLERLHSDDCIFMTPLPL